MVRPSRWLAGLAMLLLVPGAIGLAYLGFSRGLYGSWAIPLAVGAIVVGTSAALLVVLPRLRELEQRGLGRS